ncbi:hypothetical protein IAQ61_011508 [Plenodomus lingam]|uniref:uncharacterized protein n=1 Tax=Leptosphaeria maculans TaxID=5022 RepID=UPI0033267239|nr:hypothetical protein IAQ61_011508 [Plenodomus lingam]
MAPSPHCDSSGRGMQLTAKLTTSVGVGFPGGFGVVGTEWKRRAAGGGGGRGRGRGRGRGDVAGGDEWGDKRSSGHVDVSTVCYSTTRRGSGGLAHAWPLSMWTSIGVAAQRGKRDGNSRSSSSSSKRRAEV